MGLIYWTLRQADKKRIKILTKECIGKSVLDVGFRSIDDPLTKQVIDVSSSWHGVDENKDAILGAGYVYDDGHGNMGATLGKFEEINLGIKYDVVLLGEVLEHSDAPGAMIASAKQHLKKNGTILFSTPNPEWYIRGFFIAAYPLLSFLRRAGIIERVNDEHLMWFCSWTMENLAKKYGLKITWLGRLWWPSIIGKMVGMK